MRKMLFLVLSSLLLFSQCRKEETTDVVFLGFSQIPAGLNVINTYNFIVPNVEGGVPQEGLLEASPTFARLTSEGGNLNLDFIREVTLNAWRPADSSFVEIAYNLNTVINGSRRIDLIPSIADLSEFVIQDRFTLLLKIQCRSIPVNSTDLRIDFGVRTFRDQ